MQDIAPAAASRLSSAAKISCTAAAAAQGCVPFAMINGFKPQETSTYASRQREKPEKMKEPRQVTPQVPALCLLSVGPENDESKGKARFRDIPSSRKPST